MIEFIKNYFTKPSYQLTQMDKLFMSLIIIGAILILCLIVWGVCCLSIMIKNRNKLKKNIQEIKGDNKDGGKKNV